MGQKDSVYRKSPQGADALTRRDPSLTPRMRSLLILVDGKRPVEELARLAPTGGETEALVGQLLAMGMLEAVAAAAPAAAASPDTGGAAAAAPASAPAISPIKTVPLPEAQRAAVRRLTDLLGPEAEPLCLRIEATRTAQDLLAVLQRAETMVRSARGAEAASAFSRHMQAFRPA